MGYERNSGVYFQKDRSMRDAGRIAAAIEVLDTILNRHQPVKEAMRDWGKANRYAGSGDRAWISGLVLDSLRRKASVSFLMGRTRRALWC